MSTILDAAQLCRTFGKGEHAFTAVDNVSLSINSGEIHALLGPNGAGKTTIVQMCATLLTPTSGTVRIDGVDAIAHPQRARASLGLALGGDTGFYPRASARDNLLFFADLAGVSARKRRAQVASALERVDLADVAAKKVQEFSRGMKQRLHIARALLGEPKLLLLDEPTNGLDPDISLTIRQLIRSLADDGTAILLTSHLLGEIEELAHRVTVIGAGRVAVSGTVADVATHAGISATTVGRVGANAGPVLQELVLSLGDAGTLLLTPRGSEWEITVYWNERSVSEGPRPFSAEHAETLLTRILAEREVQMLTPLYTRPATLEEAYLAMAEGLKR